MNLKNRSFIKKHPKTITALAIATPLIVFVAIPIAIHVIIASIISSAIGLVLPVLPILIIAGLLQAFTPIKPFSFIKNLILNKNHQDPKLGEPKLSQDAPNVSPGHKVGEAVGGAVNAVRDVNPSSIVNKVAQVVGWLRNEIQEGVKACQTEVRNKPKKDG